VDNGLRGGLDYYVYYDYYVKHMLDKRLYTKTIAISSKDLEMIKALRLKKEFNKKSLAGILSHIINQYVAPNKKHLPEVSEANGGERT